MNHGSCRKCWWNKDGICYMQSKPKFDSIVRVDDDSYCPDYINRAKEKESIDDYLKKIGKSMKTIEELADEYVGRPEEIDEFSSAIITRQAFIDGAKKQKEIDDAHVREIVYEVISRKKWDLYVKTNECVFVFIDDIISKLSKDINEELGE